MKFLTVTSSLLVLSPMMALANGSPWLVTPGDSHLQTSYIYQSSDEFFLGEEENELPGDLTKHTVVFQYTRGLTDNLALDITTGYAKSEFEPQNAEDSDIIDSNLGITWRFIDEFIEDGFLPSLAIRLGATIAGGYETGQIFSIGDGADSVEASLVFGRVFTDYFGLFGDVGIRFREGNVPNEQFFNINSHFTVSPSLSLTASYRLVDSSGDLDIGDADFSPSRFPEVEEDSEIALVSANYSLSPSISLGITYGDVLDGRNTSDSPLLATSIGVSF